VECWFQGGDWVPFIWNVLEFDSCQVTSFDKFDGMVKLRVQVFDGGSISQSYTRFDSLRVQGVDRTQTLNVKFLWVRRSVG
jgi:hypothetical protein